MTGFAGSPKVSRWKRDPFISMAGRLASSATVGGTRLPGSLGDRVSHAVAPSPTRARGSQFGLFIVLSCPLSQL